MQSGVCKMWFYRGEVAPLLRKIDMSEMACITSCTLRTQTIAEENKSHLCNKPKQTVPNGDGSEGWSLGIAMATAAVFSHITGETVKVHRWWCCLSCCLIKGKSIWVLPCHGRHCCSWPQHTDGPPGNSISYVPLKVQFCSPLQWRYPAHSVYCWWSQRTEEDKRKQKQLIYMLNIQNLYKKLAFTFLKVL